MTNIILKAAYSRLAHADTVTFLKLDPPAGWRLSEHQVRTCEALREARPGDVVFNYALTGDGKSLGGYLTQLRNGGSSIPKSLMMFPTKELGRDQHQQLERILPLWLPDAQRQARLLDADMLDALVERRNLTRGDTLKSILCDGDFVLTNPDILHYIMQACYVRRGAEAPDQIIGQVLNLFEQLTFDEFHVFEAPQIVATTNTLMFMREIAGARCPRFLFLSATPNPLLCEYFRSANIPFHEITGEYAHGKPPNEEEWRLILRQAALSFYTFKMTEWIDAHFESTVLRFFRKHGKGAKGAIIVNSVATAQALFVRLKPICDRESLHLAINTGLDGRTTREKSYDADLLIGTSTIDIGVDFKINFLLFESRDAGTFLQRLGRLGRHDGYEREGQHYTFDQFEAHALVPNWVHEALFVGRDGSKPALYDAQSVDRESFASFVRCAFYESNPFTNYGKYWGGLQAAHNCHLLNDPLIRASYKDTRNQLAARYERVLGVPIAVEARRLAALRKDGRKPLADEALSFRGGSLFDCGVVDARVQNPRPEAKKYDLLWLLSNTDFKPITKQEFECTARANSWNAAVLGRFSPIAYGRFTRMLDEPNRLSIMVGHDLQTLDADWWCKAQVLDRIRINAQGIDGLNVINNTLEQTPLPVLLSPLGPFELRHRLRLPPLFELYEMQGRGGNVDGTIAFGRHALMLDAILRDRKDMCSSQTAIIS